MISEKIYNRRYRRKCERLRENYLKPGTIFYINPARCYWKVKEWIFVPDLFQYPRLLMVADFVYGKKPDTSIDKSGSWLDTQCIDAIKKKTWTVLITSVR